MTTRAFSPKLKIFSNNRFLFQLLLLLLAVTIGCSDSGPVRPLEGLGERPVNQQVKQQQLLQAPRAPWEMWSAETYGSPELALAERLAAAGRLREAVDAYGNAENSLVDSRLQQELLLRRVGTLLKLGRSQDTLEQVSKRFSDYGIATDQADPRLAIVVAYAYEHQGDVDQTLSWLGVAYRNDQKRSEASMHAMEDVRRVLRGVSPDRFDAEESKWEADGFIGPLFSNERQRRMQGGRPEQLLMTKWYSAATYQVATSQAGGASAGAAESDLLATNNQPTELVPPTGEQPITKDGLIVGALLPLSGKFAEHGLRVKEGIELAVEQAQREGKVVQLVVGDTAGEPDAAGREYERLASEGVHVVLGPLLVNTTARVATQSQRIQVPFVTFTKREKVLSGSNVGFRLGVTAEDQIRDLLAFATKEAKLSRFAVLYPENETGKELAAAFRKLAPTMKAQVLAESSYSTRISSSVESSVRMLEASPPEAIFIADALESSGALLQAIKRGSLAHVTLFGSATWDDAAAIRSYGSMLEGAVYVSPFYLASSNPETTAFIQQYRARYQRDPGVLSGQAYDAAKLAIKSFDFAGMQDVKEVRQKLVRNIRNLGDYQGVTGLLTVASTGEISRRMSVIRYSHGDLVEVMARGLKTSFTADEADEKEIGPVVR